MVSVKKVVLDVLKPHQPNALEFSRAIAAVGDDYHVTLTVLEVDENTETLQVVVAGDAIDFEAVQNTINDMGGSIHSIDEVEVQSAADAG
jgi:uncharacterized protein